MRRFFKHRLAVVAVVMLAVMVLLALGASLTPYSPTEQDPANPFMNPTLSHGSVPTSLGVTSSHASCMAAGCR